MIPVDFFELGPTPVDEEAAQLGVDTNFAQENIAECTRFRKELEALFLPQVPEGCHIRFFTKYFPYEGEGYREVCVEYDTSDPESEKFATYIENNIPNNWAV